MIGRVRYLERYLNGGSLPRVGETAPILRLETEAGRRWDDPSEDALFMYLEDLGRENAWLLVTRLDGPGFMRVTYDDEFEAFEVEYREQGVHERSRGLAFRVAHAVLTGWAFTLPEWRDRVLWERG